MGHDRRPPEFFSGGSELADCFGPVGATKQNRPQFGGSRQPF